MVPVTAARLGSVVVPVRVDGRRRTDHHRSLGAQARHGGTGALERGTGPNRLTASGGDFGAVVIGVEMKKPGLSRAFVA